MQKPKMGNDSEKTDPPVYQWNVYQGNSHQKVHPQIVLHSSDVPPVVVSYFSNMMDFRSFVRDYLETYQTDHLRSGCLFMSTYDGLFYVIGVDHRMTLVQVDTPSLESAQCVTHGNMILEEERLRLHRPMLLRVLLARQEKQKKFNAKMPFLHAALEDVLF